MSSSFCVSEEPFSEPLCYNVKQPLPTLNSDFSVDLKITTSSSTHQDDEGKLPLEFNRLTGLMMSKENLIGMAGVDGNVVTVVTSSSSSSKITKSQTITSSITNATPSSIGAATTTTSSPASCSQQQDQTTTMINKKEYNDIKRESSNLRQRSADRCSSMSTSSSSSAMKLKALKTNNDSGSSIFSSNKAGGKNAVLCRRLDECAHFHYELVELKTIELSLVEDNFDDDFSEKWFIMEVQSKEKQWKVRRSFHSLHQMDKQLHNCIFKRKFSMLPELSDNLVEDEGHIRARGKICTYFDQLTTLPVSRINCGPVLCWMEMDNRGNRVILPDSDSAINIPAVAAAHSIKPYTAQSGDELSLKVGDILSIIDKPPSNESSWWRGKKEFEVGFFPSECVELLDSEKLPHSIASRCAINTHQLKHTSSIGRKNKLKCLLMNFFSTRPNRSSLKRSGIVKERLFACDLGEHLLNSDDEEVPAILKCCSEVLEVHGIVDGIYRLSGAASTINKLRNEFDEGRLPELTSENYIQDIHSISSLLKMYFRELPNPLLTYELYDKFIEAITGRDEEVRLTKICDVIKQLPPPHYRTAEYLFRHLNKMASQDVVTSMHCKNLAIVWAPNLLRSKELEQMNCGTAALRGVGIQAVVTEYLIRNVSIIFNEENQATSDDTISSGGDTTNRALRSIMVILPSSQKLLSLEEAQERKSQLVSTHLRQKNFIEVGAGAAGLLQYHTVINPPKDKKKLREKLPSPSRLRTFFRRSQSTSFKENQASEVATKPSSAREKKSAAIDSSQQNNKSNNNDSTDSTTTTTTTNNKRNLSTSALLSNGSPAGDASFGPYFWGRINYVY